MKPDIFVLQENENGCVSLKRNTELQMCPYSNPTVTCGSHCPLFLVEWNHVLLQPKEEGVIGQIKSLPVKAHIGCSSVVISISNE